MEYIKVVMTRPDLSDLPQFPLPDGFSLRAFHEGDRAAWLGIQRRTERYAEIVDAMFDREFGKNLPAMAKRSLFLVSPAGEDIGTATAWYDTAYAGRRWGRIHWVAIVPEFQGRGLAKGMMSAAMNRLAGLRHRRAMLVTHTVRLPAIKVYLDFGFRPDMSASDAARAWALVREALPHPALADIAV